MRTFVRNLYKKAALFSAAGLMAVSLVSITGFHPASALSASTTVTANNMSGWFFYNDETDAQDSSLGSFVAGPDTAPLGEGSVQISVSGTQRRNIATYQFAGTPLSDITELGYSTYNASAGNGGSANRSGYLQFNVDFDGSDTWQKRLTFLPSNNGTVLQDTWQEWDAYNGGNALWTYSGATWPGTSDAGTTPKTWATILADYPAVSVRTTDAFMGIRVGEPYANGYTENIDDFFVNIDGAKSVFDFEPTIPTCDTSDTTTFDTFSNGSVNGQSGWSSTGSYDQAIVANTYGYNSFGCKSLRISNAVTTGAFGDQTFSYSTANEAGEADSTNNGQSGGTRSNYFEAQFDIASTVATEQSGLSISVSPDRGDGSRMSYLRFDDVAGGINVTFYDVQGTDNPANFVATDLGLISRDTPHTIKFVINYVDGPSNDTVKIYIDGSLVHTGTSWENYYRYDSEANAEQSPRTTDSLIFRAGGTAAPATSGQGFLFDNVVITTDEPVVVVPPVVTPPTTPPTTPSTTTTTPTNTEPVNTDVAVLGATDDTTTEESTDSGDTAVEGASTTNDKVAAVNPTNDNIFGLAWYWWVLILAVIASIIGSIIAALRRRNAQNQ